VNSRLVDALKLKMQPVAIILADDKPESGLHFKEGSMGGCVAAMMVAAGKKGRTAYFNRRTFGCPGGGTGLGFGDQYGKFPIDCLLSTGSKELSEQMGRASIAEGERFYKNPDLARKWVDSLPMTDVPPSMWCLSPWIRSRKRINRN